MKKLRWRMYVTTTLIGLALLGRTGPAFAQDRDGITDRLDRLERRVNEMAERQEQFMQRLGNQRERRAPMAGLRGENFRPPILPPSPPEAGPQNPHAAKLVKGLGDALGLLFLIGIICNILMTIWIFTDIRKRGEGSGIFVAMALVAGIPAAIIYALTRIGEKKA
jgi:hypothetical protein